MGSRTPFVIRVFILAGYFDIARRGIDLLANSDNRIEEKEWISRATQALGVYTAIYSFESLYSIFPGWISMEGVDMKHMYEHHYPCMVLGIAIMFHFRTMQQDRLGGFFEIAQYPFAMGLATQFCEFWFVARTFLGSKANSKAAKIVQRLLGFFFVSAFSLTVQYAFFRYVKHKFAQSEASFTAAEMAIVPTSLYLALILHPRYVKGHVRRLRELILGDD